MLMFDFANVASFKEFEEYINDPLEIGSDTRRDRLVRLFTQLRPEANPGKWHHMLGLREFTRRYATDNPFIPPMVRESEYKSRSARVNTKEFLNAWTGAGFQREKLSIKIGGLIETIKADELIMNKFVANNLHDEDYFFTKFAEWHTTILCAKRLGATRILDLGAAYKGFALVATEQLPDAQIFMADLIFAPGKIEVEPRIFELGVNAGKLEGLSDSSIDMVCAHNAFEHFSGDADSSSIREIERVLKPGGVAVITPFQGVERHTLTLNPFSCFVANEDPEGMEQSLVRFNTGMVSAFARSYELNSLRTRLMKNAPSLKPTLREVSFDAEGFDELGKSKLDILGMKVDRDVFERKNFWVLELHKENPK